MSNAIGFIGAGNMGSAILSGLIEKGGFDAKNVYVCDCVISERVKKLNTNVTNLSSLVVNSDYIILCVKPNGLISLLNDIKDIKGYENKVYVSIAAGIKISSIKAVLGDVKVIRVMPNVALTAGEGMSVLCCDDKTDESEFDFASKIFSCSGKIMKTEEKLIDSCTAINGSGPAYVFMFIEALSDAAVKNGIKREDAYTLAAQTVLGSAKMILESDEHPWALADQVCSPAGTTIEGVASLQTSGFEAAVINAIDAVIAKDKKI